MRLIVLLALLLFATTLKAQTFIAGRFTPNNNSGWFNNERFPVDSSTQKKWILTRYSALSTSYHFFNSGQAMIVAAPVGLQLNRRLTNNLYAFANASIAPAYVSFNPSFIAPDFNKIVRNKSFSNVSNMDMWSSFSLGLQYINDEKTFSISGSIGVERSSYPLLPYYRTNDQRSASANVINR
jgi:hypothetical protein